MIAKSDLVILAISATLLVAGIYRWQSNLSQSSGRHSVAESSRSNQPRTNSTNSLTAKPAPIPTNTTQTSAINSGSSVQGNFGGSEQPGTAQNTSATGNATPLAQTGSGNSGSAALYGNYAVQSGDSLSRIAILFGTSVDTLREINNINGSLINVGQNIRYPLPAN